MPLVTNDPPSTDKAPALAISQHSMFQQRIILIVFAVVVGALVWWQSADSFDDDIVQTFSIAPLPADIADLDFTFAEAAWSELQIDAEGNLKIDATLESAMVEAIAVMDGQLLELQLARMAFLFEKQFGKTASQQFMTLLPALKHYKEMEQRWWEKNTANTLAEDKLTANEPPNYAELFQLQDELLGKTVAKKMFFDQRRIAIMMSTSLQIRNDGNLTEAEKKQALLDMQARFPEKLDESAVNE
ncbi:MAG: hypothetical protein ACRBCS_07890 [Cellvibrionaceae bacterium]